jgi:hypothetical protein
MDTLFSFVARRIGKKMRNKKIPVLFPVTREKHRW